jgi:SH3 domain-containing protein
MLEFIVVALLAQRNGRLAEARGHSNRQLWLITIAFWFGAELLGAFIGVAIFGSHSEILGPVYLVALVFAVFGGVASYLYANSLSVEPWAGLPVGFVPTHAIPPGGLPVFVYPDASHQPVGTVTAGDRVMAVASAGDWIQIRTIEGWVGWVDGRQLMPVSPADPMPGAPTPPDA